MKVTTNFKCKCGLGKSKLPPFKRPGMCEATIVHHTCPDCQSEYMFKFKRPKGKSEPNQLVHTTKILKVSDVLAQIIKEDEELKNG